MLAIVERLKAYRALRVKEGAKQEEVDAYNDLIEHLESKDHNPLGCNACQPLLEAAKAFN